MKSKKLNVWVIIGAIALVALIGVVALRLSFSPPPEPYLNAAPPPGADAQPATTIQNKPHPGGGHKAM